MTTVAPSLAAHDSLSALTSRYVDPEAVDWMATRFPGVDANILMENTERGLLTALVCFAPGLHSRITSIRISSKAPSYRVVLRTRKGAPMLASLSGARLGGATPHTLLRGR
jgi:hypothetical protein|tara:strand:- start:201 stop:533 length:333 start_codon:yes stop_codon:yes gene_type:complete